jgi:hypothetical protein
MLGVYERGSAAPTAFCEKNQSVYGIDHTALANHRSHLLDQLSPRCERGRKTIR